jgi:peptide deformylase
MGQSKSAATAEGQMATMTSGVRRRATCSTLLEHPHPILSRPSYDVDVRDPKIVEIAAMLIGAMRVERCLGLTAPQLGHSLRLFCVDVTGRPEARSCAGLLVLANPEILCLSGAVSAREDCVSVSDLSGDVVRASEVVLCGYVPGSGRRVIVHADRLEARCLLHAMDHLDGILFIDRVRDLLADLHPAREDGAR